jgi:pimeloyl-ACP methyl ester carboxylesterase/DNA-binding CsgD family transcriptional regulator
MFVRFDQRGNGLSEREPSSFAFARWIEDMEAVVDAVGLQSFDIFGASQGAACAIAYAAKHPERVRRLVLYGGYVRGQMLRDESPGAIEEAHTLLHVIRLGWGRDDPAFRRVFAMKFMPDSTSEEQKAFDELARVCTTVNNAVRLIEEFFRIDVRSQAKEVRCPTLVIHCRGDQRAPYNEGLLLGSLIPDARFVTLESNNHILLLSEPAFRQFANEVHTFLGSSAGAKDSPSAFGQLTTRENEILERIAQGLDNAQIAAHLSLSEKTVRNHITHIFDKIGVENRSQAIVLAREHGLGQQSRPS